MTRSQAGFTMVELVITMVVGSILTSIALSTFQGAQSRFAARGAKQIYAAIHYRARAHAIEMGENVMLEVDPVGDSVWIEHDGVVLEKIRFGDEMNLDLRIVPNAITSLELCFSPRGYTDTDCNSTNSVLRLEFWQATDSAGMWLLPFGQLVGL